MAPSTLLYTHENLRSTNCNTYVRGEEMRKSEPQPQRKEEEETMRRRIA